MDQPTPRLGEIEPADEAAHLELLAQRAQALDIPPNTPESTSGADTPTRCARCGQTRPRYMMLGGQNGEPLCNAGIDGECFARYGSAKRMGETHAQPAPEPSEEANRG